MTPEQIQQSRELHDAELEARKKKKQINRCFLYTWLVFGSAVILIALSRS